MYPAHPIIDDQIPDTEFLYECPHSPQTVPTHSVHLNKREIYTLLLQTWEWSRFAAPARLEWNSQFFCLYSFLLSFDQKRRRLLINVLVNIFSIRVCIPCHSDSHKQKIRLTICNQSLYLSMHYNLHFVFRNRNRNVQFYGQKTSTEEIRKITLPNIETFIYNNSIQINIHMSPSMSQKYTLLNSHKVHFIDSIKKKYKKIKFSII